MSTRLAFPNHRPHITPSTVLSLEKLGDLLPEAKYVASIDHSSLLTASKHLQRGGLT